LLAEKTGWTIDYILWEIPLSVLCQANHVWMWMNGAKVVRRNYANSKEKHEIASLLGVEI
jgi:hypothetical protein